MRLPSSRWETGWWLKTGLLRPLHPPPPPHSCLTTLHTPASRSWPCCGRSLGEVRWSFDTYVSPALQIHKALFHLSFRLCRVGLLLASPAPLQPSVSRRHHLLRPAWLRRLTRGHKRGRRGERRKREGEGGFCVLVWAREWIFCIFMMSYLWNWGGESKRDEGRGVNEWMKNE